DKTQSAIDAPSKAAGLQVASAADYESGAIDPEELLGAGVIHYDKLGVAVVNALPEQLQSFTAAAAEDNAILSIEPERYYYVYSQEDGDEPSAEPDLSSSPAAFSVPGGPVVSVAPPPPPP